MGQHESLDERGITRAVLHDLGEHWGAVWRQAHEFQRDNPGLLAIGERSTSDPVEACAALVPQLAQFHPTVIAAAIAFCEAVVAELGLPVTGRREDHGRESEQEFASDGDRDVDGDVGGQQLHDRLAEVERRLRTVENEFEDLYGVLDTIAHLLERRAARAAAVRFTAES